VIKLGLIQKTDRFVQYRYRISEFKLLYDGHTEDIPPIKIVGLGIEHDYEQAIFPVFKVSMVLDANTYYKIIKNKNTVRFKIRMQKYYINTATGAMSLLTDVFKNTYSLFLPDNTTDFEESINTVKDKDTNEYYTENAVDFFLFKEDGVNGIRTEVNKVLSNCDMTTALAWLFYKAGLKNVLMSPLDNLTKYPEIVLPSQSIIDNIKFLDAEYGFYKTCSLLYFGLNTTYLLKFNNKCTAWKKNEWKDTVIYVLEKSNTASSISSAILRADDKKYYINVQSDYISINNISIASNILGGNDAEVIDADSDAITTGSSSAITKDGNNHTRTIQNDSQNKYIASTYAAQSAANSIVVNIAMGDYNIEAIQPNKSISIIFEDSKLNSKYKGKYKVNKAFIKFLKDGEDFSLETSVGLKKM
jgi:hypothetical protein